MKTPQLLLRRVYADGNREEPQLYEINEIHADWKMGRRGFLLTTAVGVSALSCMTTPKTTKAASNAPEITGGCADEIKAHIGPVESVACSPDGKLLASGSSDKSIKLWEMPKGKLLNTLTGHGGVGSVSFSPDGKLLASGSSDKSIKLWEMPTGKLLNTLLGHKKDVVSVSFSPDGKLLASGSAYDTIKLWEMPTGKLLNTLLGHKKD